jgi:hypothetical protein
MDQTAQDEVVFSVGMQIDRTAGIGRPNILAGFVLAGPAMIGGHARRRQRRRTVGTP